MKEVFDHLFEKDDVHYRIFSTRLAGWEDASIEKLSPLCTETLRHMLLGGVSKTLKENRITLACIKGGNSLLPEKLASPLQGNIHLNMPLSAVKKEGNDFVLTFQNGERVRAEILVLAMPCSVYEDIAFDPKVIPNEKLESIQKIQYGTNAKILVPVNKKDLPRPPSCINARGAGFLDSTQSFITVYYTKDAGLFSPDTIEKTYCQEKPMIEEGFKELSPSQKTPVFAQDEAWVSYDGPVGYSWPNDPFVKGSYTYFAAGQEELFTEMEEIDGEKVKTLFTPIGELYFVGEHATILLDAVGTMEAACESGERTVRMILHAVRKS